MGHFVYKRCFTRFPSRGASLEVENAHFAANDLQGSGVRIRKNEPKLPSPRCRHLKDSMIFGIKALFGPTSFCRGSASALFGIGDANQKCNEGSSGSLHTLP